MDRSRVDRHFIFYGQELCFGADRNCNPRRIYRGRQRSHHASQSCWRRMSVSRKSASGSPASCHPGLATAKVCHTWTMRAPTTIPDLRALALEHTEIVKSSRRILPLQQLPSAAPWLDSRAITGVPVAEYRRKSGSRWVWSTLQHGAWIVNSLASKRWKAESTRGQSTFAKFGRLFLNIWGIGKELKSFQSWVMDSTEDPTRTSSSYYSRLRQIIRSQKGATTRISGTDISAMRRGTIFLQRVIRGNLSMYHPKRS